MCVCGGRQSWVYMNMYPVCVCETVLVPVYARASVCVYVCGVWAYMDMNPMCVCETVLVPVYVCTCICVCTPVWGAFARSVSVPVPTCVHVSSHAPPVLPPPSSWWYTAGPGAVLPACPMRGGRCVISH